MNGHVKLVCERCNVVALASSFDGFDVGGFYAEHAACKKPQWQARPFEPTFIRRIVAGVFKGTTTTIPTKPSPTIPSAAWPNVSVASSTKRPACAGCRIRNANRTRSTSREGNHEQRQT